MKTEIRFGALFAGIVVAYVLLEHILGLNTSRHDLGQYTRFGGVLVPILGIFFGLRAKRMDLGGLTMKEGLKAGFVIALVQTTLTTAWFLFYSSVINSDFLDTMLAFERDSLVATGTPEQEILMQIEGKRAMFAFPSLQLFQMVAGITYGVVFAAIFSFFLKRGQAHPEQAANS